MRPAASLLVATLLLIIFSFATLRAENGISTRLANPATAAVLKEKLQMIIFDKVNFDKVEVTTAVEILNKMAKEQDPNRVGVKIVYLPPAGSPPVQRQVSLALQDVSLKDVLDRLVQQVHLAYTVEGDHVVIKAAP